MEARAARRPDLDAAAGWLGLESPPATWIDDLELGASQALDEEGSLAALAVLRPWGRVLCAPALLVDPARRERGHGRRIVAALREEALRREARSVGLEADPFDGESLAALLRCGFKAGPPAVELEWELPPAVSSASAASAAGEPEPGSGSEDALDADAEAAEPREEPPPEPGVDEVAALAGSLDAALEPGEWIERRRAAGARLVGSRGEDGALRAAALLEPAEGDEPASCPLMLLDESEPFHSLGPLAEALAAAGARSLSLVVPARQADALRALLRAGAVVRALRLRLSLEGFPQRADLRRAVLASWR